MQSAVVHDAMEVVGFSICSVLLCASVRRFTFDAKFGRPRFVWQAKIFVRVPVSILVSICVSSGETNTGARQVSRRLPTTTAESNVTHVCLCPYCSLFRLQRTDFEAISSRHSPAILQQLFFVGSYVDMDKNLSTALPHRLPATKTTKM